MKFIFCLLIGLPFYVKAQYEFIPVTKTLFSIDLGLSGVQFGAELKTAKTQTVQFRAGMNPVLYMRNMSGGFNNLKLAGSIAVSGEYRFYYNLHKRKERMGDIRNNGASYFGFLMMFTSVPVVGKPDFAVQWPDLMAGPVWGFNRPMGERFNVHASLGPVYQGYRNETAYETKSNVSFYLDLRWSFIINRVDQEPIRTIDVNY